MGTEPYILSGFTDRFFTKRATGAEMMMFFSCSVLGTWTCAKLLDRYSQQGHQERGAHVAIAVFTAVHVLSFCCGGAVEFSQRPVPTGGWGLADFDIILPTVAFVLWGASDAMMNTYTYWVIGNMYPDGAQQARAIGFSKMLNSGAHVLGYAILPTGRASGCVQFLLNVAFFALGVTTAFFVKPTPARLSEACLAG